MKPISRHVKGKVYEVYNGVNENQELFRLIEEQVMPIICINDNDNIDFEPMKAFKSRLLQKSCQINLVLKNNKKITKSEGT